MNPPAVKPAIHYLILSITDRCNLTCSYCYRAATAAGADMPPELIDQAIKLVDHGKPCHIQVTGGEPLLVLAQLEQIGKLAQTMKRRPRLGIQTNATLLNAENAALLKQYGFVVGVSLDGPPNIHDELRGRAADTLKGLRILEAQQIDFGVTTVVTANNVLVLDQLILLLAHFANSRGLGLDLLTDRGRGMGKAQPATVAQLQQGLARMMQALTYVNRQRRVPLKLRELEIMDQSQVAFCRAAMGESLAVTPQGELYPCGQTIGDRDFFLGTLPEPRRPETSPLMQAVLKAEDCSGCALEQSCPGECPSRLYYNGQQGQQLACALYQSLFQHREPPLQHEEKGATRQV